MSCSTRGEAIPDWRAYDFLAVMGAAADVWDHDRHPWIAAEEETVREAVLAGVPYFGVCFGAQLLASAFGAHNYRGMEAERSGQLHSETPTYAGVFTLRPSSRPTSRPGVGPLLGRSAP